MSPQRRRDLLEGWANVRKSAEELEVRLGSVEPEHGDYGMCEAVRDAEIVALSDMRKRARAISHVATNRIATLMENGGKI